MLDEAGPVAELEQLLRSAIDEFCSQLPVSAEHPFAARKPDDYWLTLRSVVMHTQSHQVPHIHPSAWLSGVYYVEVPEVVLAGDSNGGWIEFGSRPSHFHARSEPLVEIIQPEEGLLLLFPSYFYHRTIAHEADQRRISMAFDVVPA
ncbi:MAG TPA: hypothetical protein EYM51_01225 [Gammaproteobacteria bacterium]|nr:hypothetical protein [Gammaproteobacteria bacterium]